MFLSSVKINPGRNLSENFRPFGNKSELIAEYANHSSIRDKEDLVFVLRDKCNSIIRTFRLKGNREFPYDIEDGAVLDWHTLYENYTFLDGSPCGKKAQV